MSEREGRCSVCRQLVRLTKRGLAMRHSRWHQKGLSAKSGRYWNHCEGSFKPSGDETPPPQEPR
jgi:hypothetical protein